MRQFFRLKREKCQLRKRNPSRDEKGIYGSFLCTHLHHDLYITSSFLTFCLMKQKSKKLDFPFGTFLTVVVRHCYLWCPSRAQTWASLNFFLANFFPDRRSQKAVFVRALWTKQINLTLGPRNDDLKKLLCIDEWQKKTSHVWGFARSPLFVRINGSSSVPLHGKMQMPKTWVNDGRPFVKDQSLKYIYDHEQEEKKTQKHLAWRHVWWWMRIRGFPFLQTPFFFFLSNFNSSVRVYLNWIQILNIFWRRYCAMTDCTCSSRTSKQQLLCRLEKLSPKHWVKAEDFSLIQGQIGGLWHNGAMIHNCQFLWRKT